MSNVNRTPFRSLPNDWAFHPEIGPFIRELMDEIDQLRRRTGGDDDSIEFAIQSQNDPGSARNADTIEDEAETAQVLAYAALRKAETEGWKDNFANLTAAATGSGTPSLQPFGPSGNVKQRRFGVGDSVYVVWHIDHDIKPGSTCYMHVHWSSDGTSTNTVKWELNYTTATRDTATSTDYFPADTTLTIEEASDGTAWRHKVSEDTVGLTIPSVDSLIICEVKRITNGGTDNSDDVFGLFVDIHYESDRETTPSRAPDFYAQ